MSFSIQNIIDEAVSQTEDRAKERWWATDLGKCLGGAYYRRLGHKGKDFDTRLLRVFKVGHLFEEFVIKLVREYSDKYEFTQPETIYMPEHDLACRPDLVIKDKATGEQWVYEFKTVHSQKFWWMQKKNEGPDKHYLMQTYCELLATGLEQGRLIYISKDDLCMAEFAISKSDTELEMSVKKDILALKEAWRLQIPPPVEPAIVNGKINWKAQSCPFHNLCLHNDNWLEEAKAQLASEKKSSPGRWAKVSKKSSKK